MPSKPIRPSQNGEPPSDWTGGLIEAGESAGEQRDVSRLDPIDMRTQAEASNARRTDTPR
jgi:hypothetical protein